MEAQQVMTQARVVLQYECGGGRGLGNRAPYQEVRDGAPHILRLHLVQLRTHDQAVWVGILPIGHAAHVHETLDLGDRIAPESVERADGEVEADTPWRQAAANVDAELLHHLAPPSRAAAQAHDEGQGQVRCDGRLCLESRRPVGCEGRLRLGSGGGRRCEQWSAHLGPGPGSRVVCARREVAQREHAPHHRHKGQQRREEQHRQDPPASDGQHGAQTANRATTACRDHPAELARRRRRRAAAVFRPDR
mmetsp:Transcript_27637/g.82436  ORF Transcript_27637/g.82436 Transcript_27637/m.82436 type:complete len:249 (-) Transcript_27637:33-779(-)